MFDPGRFYRPREIREIAHAPRALVYAALEHGDLRAIRRGRRWLIPGRSALEWIWAAGGERVTMQRTRVSSEGPSADVDVDAPRDYPEHPPPGEPVKLQDPDVLDAAAAAIANGKPSP
jgi:hypothetical protein